MEEGNVLTRCYNCGKIMRVSVEFPSFKEPFIPIIHRCEFCGYKNYVYDPHEYNEDGTIKNS